MTRLRTWTLVALAASGLGLAACGSSSSSSTTTTTATASTVTPGIGTISDPSAAGTFGIEPTITVPPGAPPNQLESKDLIVGTGPAPTEATLTRPVVESTETVLGSGFFSSSAVANSSSGFA